MAQGPVPTVADFLEWCPYPEAFSPGIPDATITKHATLAADWVAAAFGDRAVMPIIEWDGACEAAVYQRMAYTLMNHRGYDRDAGNDKAIADMHEDAKRLRDGIQNKTEQPYFVDSHAGAVPDAGRVLSSCKSDGWIDGCAGGAGSGC